MFKILRYSIIHRKIGKVKVLYSCNDTEVLPLKCNWIVTSKINSACKEATFNNIDMRLRTRHFLYVQAFGNTTPIFA